MAAAEGLGLPLQPPRPSWSRGSGTCQVCRVLCARRDMTKVPSRHPHTRPVQVYLGELYKLPKVTELIKW